MVFNKELYEEVVAHLRHLGEHDRAQMLIDRVRRLTEQSDALKEAA